MSAAAPELPVGDDRTSVSLSALIALRAPAGRVRLAAVRVRAARSGQHASRLLGRGMDYAESRAYQAGDDVRRLDWRLTARSGKLHTKLFEEDREDSVLVLLDRHASMRFGTRGRFKSVQAARVVASLAWRATQAGERIGLVAFGAAADEVVRPVAGLRGALAVCGALAHWDAAAPTVEREPLSRALARTRRLLHGASRVVIVSDGFSCDAAARSPLRELAQRAAVACILVADPLETALPQPGRYPMENAGRSEIVGVVSDRARRGFQRLLGAGVARFQALADGLALRCSVLETTGDAAAVAGRLFGRGSGRRA